MLNAQKLFLSGIRLVTGSLGAGWHQFQIKCLNPFFIRFLFHFYQRLPNSSPVFISKSFHSLSCCHALPCCISDCSGWGDLARELLLPMLLQLAVQGEGIASRTSALRPCRCTKSTHSPQDPRQQLGSWLAGALLLHAVLSLVPSVWPSTELRTNSFIESSSQAVGMHITSQGSCPSSPSLEPWWAAESLFLVQMCTPTPCAKPHGFRIQLRALKSTTCEGKAQSFPRKEKAGFF